MADKRRLRGPCEGLGRWAVAVVERNVAAFAALGIDTIRDAARTAHVTHLGDEFSSVRRPNSRSVVSEASKGTPDESVVSGRRARLPSSTAIATGPTGRARRQGVSSMAAVFEHRIHLGPPHRCGWRRGSSRRLQPPPALRRNERLRILILDDSLTGVGPKLINFNECAHGGRAPHCQDTTPGFDTFARAKSRHARTGGSGRASAGSEWLAHRARPIACRSA